jgi:hypothetical protein
VAETTPGLVRVVDLSGKDVARSNSYEDFSRLVWRGDDEVWFSAIEAGEPGAIRALSLSRGSRVVLSGAGALVLHDISNDGRLLITQESSRYETAGIVPGEMRERDLTWFDRTYVERT